MTHDIDFVSKFKSIRNVFGAARRQGKLIKQYQQYFKTQRDRTTDPYWSMEAMLEQNNRYGVETQFYFMAGKSDPKYDLNDYNVSDSDIKQLMRSLENQGATIGLHPSYASFNRLEIIQKEKDTLENALGKKIELSRQHFLRYEDPTTFKLLAKAGIKQDASIGFRNKIATSTKGNIPYIIYKDDVLELKEQPFVFMDTHLLQSDKNILDKLSQVIQEIKEERGVAMIIWHNNNYETSEQRDLYQQVLEIIAN